MGFFILHTSGGTASGGVYPPTANQSSFTLPDFSWQTSGFYDAVHDRYHIMGKPQGNDFSWGHQYFDGATGAWITIGVGMWNNTGHIYGNFTGNPGTGDAYCARGGMFEPAADHYKQIARFRHSTQTWDYVPAGVISANDLDNIPNGLSYHPDLYGTGDGGLVIGQHFRAICWRESTDVCEEISHSDIYGGNTSASVYWAAQNCVIGGGHHDGAAITNLYQITPNVTPGGTPTLSTLPAPPLATAGESYSAGSNFGSLHVNPRNANKLQILETNGPRVFESTDGSNWTQVGNHTFNKTPRIVIPIPAQGEYLAIGFEDGGTNANFVQRWVPGT